jgi:DNA polymerase III delta prime subunit
MFTYHGITISAYEILKYSRKSRTDDPLMTVEEILEKHEKILNEWCERNLGELVPACNSFQEIVSGETIQARPEFQTILRLIESPKYKAVFTVEVQRLSRGDLEDAGRLIKLLRYTNTFVITPDMVFDLNDEYDRERFKRELERGNDYLEYYKKINWRGRLESVKSGYFIGSVAPYGYDKDFILDGRKKRPTLKINEREAEAVRLIFDLYVNHDIGMANIAHRLDELGYKTRNGGVWVASTIKDMLTNVHYIGKIKWNWRKTVNVVADGEISKTRPKNKEYYIFDGKHPAIVDEELFNKAQIKMGKNHRTKASTQLRNPLASLVYCQCGKAMTYRTHKDTQGNERSAPRLACNNQMFCHTQSVTYDEMLSKVIETLKNCIADFEIKIKNDSENTLINHSNQIKRLEAKLEELNNKELNQWEKYSEENMPKAIFDKLNEKVLQDKETVIKALEKAKATAPTVEDYQERLSRFTDALNGLQDPNVSAQTKNKLLKACIERIVYTREKGSRWRNTEFELDITLKA